MINLNSFRENIQEKLTPLPKKMNVYSKKKCLEKTIY